MSLFVCQNCHHIENTALCYYWMRLANDEALTCSLCDPDLGKWHGVFERRIIAPDEKVIDGFVVRVRP